MQSQQKLEGGLNADEVNRKFASVLSSVTEAYDKAKDDVNQLYQDLLNKNANSRGKSPELQQVEKAKKVISDFHKFAVAQLVTADLQRGAMPSKGDYKNAFKKLGEEEQRMKLQGFYKDAAPQTDPTVTHRLPAPLL